MATKRIFITATGAGTFTIPSDWTSTNSIEVIGGGAGGGTGAGAARGGGGGGQYRIASNVGGLSGTIDLSVGTGGGAQTAGGNTWWNGTTFGGATLSAQGGQTTTTATAGVGGSTGTGGSGSNGGAAGAGGNALTGGGGGGASGPGGVGGTGGKGDDTTAGADFGGGGGSGAGTSTGGGAGTQGSTSAGVGGTNANGGGSGGNGGSGAGVTPTAATSMWTSTHLPDTTTPSVVSISTGGGGGGGGSASGAGGNGSNYGAGGGGAGNGTGGSGTQGVIIITYVVPDIAWFETSSIIEQPRQPNLNGRRASALRSKSQFAAFDLKPFDNWIQPVQPPHPRREKLGSVVKGIDAIERPYVFVAPPSPAWQWEPILLSPRRPYRRQITGGDPGNASLYSIWRNWGWQVSAPTVDKRPRQIPSSVMWDDGTQAPLVVTQLIRYADNFDEIFISKKRRQTYSAVMWDDGTQGQLETWRNYGWQIEPPTLPRPKSNRGAFLEGIDGVERPYVVQVAVNYFDTVDDFFVQRNRVVHSAIMWDDGATSPLVNFFPFGWPIQAWQPPQPKWMEKFGTIAPKDDGIYRPKDLGLQTGDFPWQESPWVYPRMRYAKWGGIAPREDGIELPFSFFRDHGFAVQPWQPPHPAYEKHFAAFAPGEPAIDENPFRQFFPHGWPIQPWQPPHPRPERWGSIAPKSDGTEGQKPFGLQTGDFRWMETPWVYPRAATRLRAQTAAIARGIDGADTLRQFFPFGWFVQPWQPPNPRPEKWGAVAIGEDGIEKPFVPPFVFVYSPDLDETIVRRRPRMVPDDNTWDGWERFTLWRNAGWEVQPWQPPHRGTEHRIGAILEGIDGIEGRFERFFNFGWPIQPWQPPHRGQEWHGAGLLPAWFIDGTFFPIEPFVPPPAILPRNPTHLRTRSGFELSQRGASLDRRGSGRNIRGNNQS
jgi:hypothetical protein